MRRSAGERMSVVSTRQEIAAMRWEPGRAWSYMEKFGTIVGCNFVPSYCYNYIQLWYDFREPIIARELDWAKECGVNSLRMFLPLFSFQRGGGWESVKKNVDRFYEMASERGFSIMQTALALRERGGLVRGRELVPVYHRLSQAERERLAREQASKN